MFLCRDKLGDCIGNWELWLDLGIATWELEHRGESQVNFSLDIFF